MEKLITIITPTTGKSSLNKLFASIDRQDVPWTHILLWDDKREDKYLYPNWQTLTVQTPYDLPLINSKLINCKRYSIIIPGKFVNGKAAGSSLRAIGLMAANTKYVTFADDDVWYENNHLSSMIETIEKEKALWGYCVRKIWTAKGEYLGEDRFESVGDSERRKVPYEMVDNNSMIFIRQLGSGGAFLYRETVEYNDDRLMYSFLKKHGNKCMKTNLATVNQICPPRLEEFFRQGCLKNKE